MVMITNRSCGQANRITHCKSFKDINPKAPQKASNESSKYSQNNYSKNVHERSWNETSCFTFSLSTFPYLKSVLIIMCLQLFGMLSTEECYQLGLLKGESMISKTR